MSGKKFNEYKGLDLPEVGLEVLKRWDADGGGIILFALGYKLNSCSYNLHFIPISDNGIHSPYLGYFIRVVLCGAARDDDESRGVFLQRAAHRLTGFSIRLSSYRAGVYNV
jgi:hypothetical protein